MTKSILRTLVLLFIAACITSAVTYFSGHPVGITRDPVYDLLQVACILIMFNILDRFFPLGFKKEIEPEKVKCLHEHYGPIADGFQYCDSCGLARVVPVKKCEQHKYEIINKIEVPNKQQGIADMIKGENQLSEIIFVSRCENCGTIKEDRINCLPTKCTYHK